MTRPLPPENAMIDPNDLPAMILAIVGFTALLGVAVWDYRRTPK